MSFRNVGVSDVDVYKALSINKRIELAVLMLAYYSFKGLLTALVGASVALALVVTLAIVLSPIWVTAWLLA